MASIVTAMKLSDDYNDFVEKLDILHPRYEETMAMEFMQDNDAGKGI
jgi:hypothetical protein